MKQLTVFLVSLLVLISTACDPKGGKKPNDGTNGPDPKPTNPDQVIKGNLKLVTNTDFQGNIERYAIFEDTGKKHGKYQRLSSDSTILEEATYDNGLLDGVRIIYYENRDTQVLETHQKGKFHGPYYSYYENGGLRLEGVYTENRMDGRWYKYYETGELMEEVTFAENMENGPFIEYHKNGQKSVTGTYLDGDNEHGELKFYTEDGIHFKTMDCNEGLCQTTWKLEEENL